METKITKVRIGRRVIKVNKGDFILLTGKGYLFYSHDAKRQYKMTELAVSRIGLGNLRKEVSEPTKYFESLTRYYF